MDARPTTRPLLAADVPAAHSLAHAAIGGMLGAGRVPDHDDFHEARRRRMEHMLTTDPEGAWLAERGGEPVGVTLALRRDGLWFLSLLAVAPRHQGRGIGSVLLDHALEHRAGTRGAVVVSSTHPAAMRAYVGAGLTLHPAVSLSGAWDPRRLTTGLRSRTGDLGADAETIDRAGMHVRGASHRRDLPILLAEPGTRLLVCENRGFAVVREDGSPLVLAALDSATAADLLLSGFASGPRGGSVEVGPLTAQQDWAIRAGLDVGLALSVEGPVLRGGATGAGAPWIPSGAFG